MRNFNRIFASAVVWAAFISNGVEAKAQSAQGVMVNFKNPSSYAIGGTNTYQFDSVNAGLAYFFNDAVSLNVTCVGTASQCDYTNQPNPPLPPASDYTKAAALAESSKCVFLDGGALTQTSSYTQSVVMLGLNGQGQFTFEYVYNVYPASNFVAPYTYWNLVSSTGPSGKANVQVDADIFAESVTKDSKGKISYSFTLEAAGKSRIRDLSLSLNGTVIAKPGSSLTRNCPGCLAGSPGAVDFLFGTNAGSKGTTSLLKIGDARTILNTDSSSTNNNGGSNGSALAKGTMNTVAVQVPVGSHRFKLTGRVLKVDLIADQTFEVNSNVSVVAPGCSQP